MSHLLEHVQGTRRGRRRRQSSSLARLLQLRELLFVLRLLQVLLRRSGFEFAHVHPKLLARLSQVLFLTGECVLLHVTQQRELHYSNGSDASAPYPELVGPAALALRCHLQDAALLVRLLHHLSQLRVRLYRTHSCAQPLGRACRPRL